MVKPRYDNPLAPVGQGVQQAGQAIANYFQMTAQRQFEQERLQTQAAAQAAQANQRRATEAYAETMELLADPDLMDEGQRNSLRQQADALKPLAFESFDATDIEAVEAYNQKFTSVMTGGGQPPNSRPDGAPVVTPFSAIVSASRAEQESSRNREATQRAYTRMLESVAANPSIEADARRRTIDTWLSGMNLDYLSDEQISTLSAVGGFEDVTAIEARQAQLRSAQTDADRSEVALKQERFDLETARMERGVWERRVDYEFADADRTAVMEAVRTGMIGSLTDEQKRLYADYLGVEPDSEEFSRAHREQSALFRKAQDAELSAAALAEKAAELGLELDSARLARAQLDTSIAEYEFGRRKITDDIESSAEIATDLDRAIVRGDTQTIRAYQNILMNPDVNPEAASYLRELGYTATSLTSMLQVAETSRKRVFEEADTRSQTASANLARIQQQTQAAGAREPYDQAVARARATQALFTNADMYNDIDTFERDVSAGVYDRYTDEEVSFMRTRVRSRQAGLLEQDAAAAVDNMLANPPLLGEQNREEKNAWREAFVEQATEAGMTSTVAHQIASSVLVRGQYDLAQIRAQAELAELRLGAAGTPEAEADLALTISEQLRVLEDEEQAVDREMRENFCLPPETVNQLAGGYAVQATVPDDYAASYQNRDKGLCESLNNRQMEISSIRSRLLPTLQEFENGVPPSDRGQGTPEPRGSGTAGFNYAGNTVPSETVRSLASASSPEEASQILRGVVSEFGSATAQALARELDARKQAGTLPAPSRNEVPAEPEPAEPAGDGSVGARIDARINNGVLFRPGSPSDEGGGGGGR